MKGNIKKTLASAMAFAFVCLGGAMSIASCSSDKDAPIDPRPEVGQGVSVDFELELPLEDPQLAGTDGARVAHLFDYDMEGVYDHSGSVASYLAPILKLSEGDRVPVVAYIRRASAGASVESFRIEDAWTVRIRDGKKSLYLKKTKMTLPTGWNLENTDTDAYYLMAMAGGDRSGNSIKIASTDAKVSTLATGDVAKLPGVYLMEWSKLTKEGTTLRAREENRKSFKPQGTILVLRTRNDMTSSATLRGIRLSSNVFDFSGSYKDLHTLTVSDTPTFLPDEGHSADYLIRDGNATESLAPGSESAYFACWVMPRGSRGIWRPSVSALSTPYTKVSALLEGRYWSDPSTTPGGIVIDGSVIASASSVNTRDGLDAWRSGYYYGLGDVPITRRKYCLPIEAFYFKNEISGIPDWWHPYQSSRQPLHYVDVEDYVRRQTRNEVGGRQYDTPTIKEWRTIFPPLQGGPTSGAYSNTMILPIEFK